MKVVVTYIAEGIFHYPELAEWVRGLDENPDDEMFDALSLMDGDPDIIRCEGRRMCFIVVPLGGKRFVLTSDYPDDKEKRMLSLFHSDNRDDFYKTAECSWQMFDSLPNAIAYRGGRGYYYEINEYTGHIT